MSITFDQIKLFDNGAHFYTADLHVHTFGGSDDVSDAFMTVESVIDAAVHGKISLLAITDHNNDANVLRAIDYATKYAGQLLVLPGVEVTTAHGHLLVYFAPEKADSVRDLLALVKIVGKRGSRDSHTALSMADVIGEAERLGGVAVAAHVDREKTGFEMIGKGYPNWKKDVICASGLYGLEFDDSTRLNWYSTDDEPTPDGSERKKLINARSLVPGLAARARLAALQGSDSHSLAAFSGQLTKRTLTRLKMNDLSFDGFRTALIDPGARVRAVATIPPAIPRILGMQVNGGFVDSCTFHFSDNLNCFIGGRGTGKSTALKSLAYGLGINDEFENYDNCPDNSVIYCEDAEGTRYRYERIRGNDPAVLAKEDQSITNVPRDAFRVEFYGQGELSEVAKDPLKNPTLLQGFLDRHIVLLDLIQRETALLQDLEQNSSQLIPLENTAAQLPAKKALLSELNKKLEIAETGRLKDIVALQTRLASERALSDSLAQIESAYQTGLTLQNFRHDYTHLTANAGALTGDKECEILLQQIKEILANSAAFLDGQQQVLNTGLKAHATKLHTALAGLRIRHNAIEQQLNLRITDLQKKGLSGDLRGLNELIKQKMSLQGDILRIEGQAAQLTQLRQIRTDLRAGLTAVRVERMDRRKGQVSVINKNLKQTIEDYAINLYYDQVGVVDAFLKIVIDVMRGTYFQEETARDLCSRLTPQQLAEFVAIRDITGLASIVGDSWARELVNRFSVLASLHALEVADKPPKPIIKVLTKSSVPKQIPVTQLSDGQKHTILLTIAMLAESNLPLLIDQPEDDLDNAFIFKSIVSTLRSIKERRQVIVVTHNANIAVLGDSELICPMRRSGDKGGVFDRGSIDRGETRAAVQNILEGGELAFRRRKEIYGY
jgi:hypothetical protein